MSCAGGPALAAPAPTSDELQRQLLMYAQDLHDLMQQQSQLQHRYRMVLQSHARSDQSNDSLVNAVQHSGGVYLVTDHLGCISQASEGARRVFAANGQALEARFMSHLAAAGESTVVDALLKSLLGANATGAIQRRQLTLTDASQGKAQTRYNVLAMPARRLDRVELYWLFSAVAAATSDALEIQDFLPRSDDETESLMVTNSAGVICAVNPAFSRITGYSADEALGHTPRMLNSGRHEADFHRAFWAHLQDDGSWTGEFFNRNKSGHIYTEWKTVKAVKDADGDTIAYICASADISNRASAAEEMTKLAYIDPVTGFANRHRMQERLKQALEQAANDNTGLCLLVIELDEFKLISGAFGTALSDRFLQQIGTRLLSALPTGHILARTGEDNFTVLLQGYVDEGLARDLAETLRRRLSTPIRVDEHEVSVGVGIGCARAPLHGSDLSDLLRHANSTMYEPSRYAMA